MNARTVAAVLALAGGVEAWGGAPRLRFISHRGESTDRPENTMAAFRAAAERGADGFECDVYLTKDNEIVCLHDATAKRTAGKDVKPCDATLAELRALDAGSWKDRRFAGERLPTLAEALSLARDDFEIYVEVKCGAEILPRLSQVVAAEPRATPERVRFICFSTNVVAALARQMPAYRTYWLTSPKRGDGGAVAPSAAATVAAAKACGAAGVDAKASDALSAAYVREVRAAGLSFHVWTVNSVRQAKQMAAIGVETVTSDCGAALAALLRPRPAGEPVIHWALDGSAANSGSGGAVFDAELSGAPAFTNGVGGPALALDGADDVASVACPLGEQGMVSLWYRPESFYNFNTVFDCARNPDQWEMWIARDGRLRFRMGKGSGDVAYDLKPQSCVGRWHHFALAWDSRTTNTTTLYVDGVARCCSTNGPWNAPGGALGFGGGNPGNTKGRGAVDDVRVYETTLTAPQVRELYERKARHD